MNEQYRAVADQIVKTMDQVSKLPKSRETSITFTKLEEAMMWLMKVDLIINELSVKTHPSPSSVNSIRTGRIFQPLASRISSGSAPPLISFHSVSTHLGREL